MLTKEQALASVGKSGKVFNGANHHYGHVVDVHHSGEYVRFERIKMHAKWFDRKDVTLNENETAHGPSELPK